MHFREDGELIVNTGEEYLMPQKSFITYSGSFPRRFLTSIVACSRACWIRSSLSTVRPQLAHVVPVTSATSLISVPQCTVRSWLQPGHLNGTLLIIVDLVIEGGSCQTVATTASVLQGSFAVCPEATLTRESGLLADEKTGLNEGG